MDKLKNLEMVSLIANRIEGELAQLKMWIKANIDAVNNEAEEGDDVHNNNDGDGVHDDDYYYSAGGSKNSDENERIDEDDRGASDDYTESTYDNSRDYEEHEQKMFDSGTSNFGLDLDDDDHQSQSMRNHNDQYQDQPEEIEIKPLIASSYLYSSPEKTSNNFTNNKQQQQQIGFPTNKQIFSRNAQMQIIPLTSSSSRNQSNQQQRNQQINFPHADNNFLIDNNEEILQYGCNIRRCGKKFLNLNLLRAHQEAVHNIIDNGSFNTSLLPELQQQEMEFSTGDPLNFNHIKKSFKHSSASASTKFFKCCYCPKIFITYHKLKVHKTRQHPSVLVYACDFENCKERFISETTLASHKEIAHQGKLCVYCSSMYFKRSSYFNHLERVHNKCARAGCDKMFDSKTALLIHKRKHTYNTSANSEPGETINMNIVRPQNTT